MIDDDGVEGTTRATVNYLVRWFVWRSRLRLGFE